KPMPNTSLDTGPAHVVCAGVTVSGVASANEPLRRVGLVQLRAASPAVDVAGAGVDAGDVPATPGTNRARVAGAARAEPRGAGSGGRGSARRGPARGGHGPADAAGRRHAPGQVAAVGRRGLLDVGGGRAGRAGGEDVAAGADVDRAALLGDVVEVEP